MSVEEEEEEEEDTLTTQDVKIKAKNAGFYLHVLWARGSVAHM